MSAVARIPSPPLRLYDPGPDCSLAFQTGYRLVLLDSLAIQIYPWMVLSNDLAANGSHQYGRTRNLYLAR